MASSYKPSPLSYGSPRASPFRRPESPHSPSPLRQSTPTASSRTPTTSPTKMPAVALFNSPEAERKWVPSSKEPELSPTKGANRPHASSRLGSSAGLKEGNALGRLQPAQIRELREGFGVLDRDSDGMVGREDVSDMLTQLGLSTTPSELATFFPSGAAQATTLPAFMNEIAAMLTELSPSSELLSAFAAFDEDDSGQVDVAELRDALLNTQPEPGVKALTEREIERVVGGFTGRRAFGKGSGGLGRKGEVFRYQEFVGSVSGQASVERKDGEGE